MHPSFIPKPVDQAGTGEAITGSSSALALPSGAKRVMISTDIAAWVRLVQSGGSVAATTAHFICPVGPPIVVDCVGYSHVAHLRVGGSNGNIVLAAC